MSSQSLSVAVLTSRFSRPSYRFRLEQFFPVWQQAGITIESFEVPKSMPGRLQLACQLRRFDRVIVQQKLLAVWELAWLRKWARRVIYDVDAAVMFRTNGDVHSRQLARFHAMVRTAEMTVCGNANLAEFARSAGGKTMVIPTVVDTDRFCPAESARQHSLVGDGKLQLGWTGSRPSNPHLNTILPAIGKLQGVELQIMSDTTEGLDFSQLGNVPYRFTPWSAAREISFVQELDVGLMPLTDNAFTRGKCGCKALQYLACAVPCIATGVGVNQQIVQPNRTGLLADTLSEWHVALQTLVENAPLRAKMGEAGRALVEQEYSVKTWGARWLQLVQPNLLDESFPQRKAA